jgi:hypothetical protein
LPSNVAAKICGENRRIRLRESVIKVLRLVQPSQLDSVNERSGVQERSELVRIQPIVYGDRYVVVHASEVNDNRSVIISTRDRMGARLLDRGQEYACRGDKAKIKSTPSCHHDCSDSSRLAASMCERGRGAGNGR